MSSLFSSGFRALAILFALSLCYVTSARGDDNVYSEWDETNIPAIVFRTVHHKNASVSSGEQWFLELKRTIRDGKNITIRMEIETWGGWKYNPDLVMHGDGSTTTWVSPTGRITALKVSDVQLPNGRWWTQR